MKTEVQINTEQLQVPLFLSLDLLHDDDDDDDDFTYRRIGHAPSHMLVWNPVTSSNKSISKISEIFCFLYEFMS